VGGHVPRRGAGTEHDAQHIDRHHAMEVFEIITQEAFVHLAGDTGVVDHDVESAKAVDRCVDKGLDVRGVRNVGVPEPRAHPTLRGDVLAGVVVDVGDDDIGTRFDELLDDSSAETRCAAGDDGNLPYQ